jgi:hypothetical protein
MAQGCFWMKQQDKSVEIPQIKFIKTPAAWNVTGLVNGRRLTGPKKTTPKAEKEAEASNRLKSDPNAP